MRTVICAASHQRRNDSDDQKSFDGDFSNTMSNPMGALTDKQKREVVKWIRQSLF